MIKRAFGTHEIARLCQVTPPTVGRWIEEGKLASFMTAGGHRRVWSSELFQFLQSLNIPVPLELEAGLILKIVIVDDEATPRGVVRKILEGVYPRAKIYEVEDGFEAGQTIAMEMPSLVVLDIKLPGIDGIRVCRLLRANEKLKDIKILAVSGHLVKESRDRILKAGADDFLSKPFEPGDFAQKVKKLLQWEPGLDL